MENATKALLIAAAVLIAIVLIALGVSLLNSSGDAADEAAQTANAIQGATANAITDITNSLSGLTINQ